MFPLHSLRLSILLLVATLLVASAGCKRTASSGSLPPQQSAIIEKEVRAFLASMADDVTKRGPVAWRTHFADKPTFYMASEGKMVFADSAAATKGINELTGMISQIKLNWGEPLRVEPLTSSIVSVAMPYHEELSDTQGNLVVEDGYFTGLIESGPDGWKVRNAHWSVRPKA